MARRLDGKTLASKIRAHLAGRIRPFAPRMPVLALFRVGEDPASVVYVRNKEKTAAEVGVESRVTVLSEKTGEDDLLALIDIANADPEVNGILVQMPLPGHIDHERVIDHISPQKDVDGLHPANQGRLALGRPSIIPCTPLGILTLLLHHGIRTGGSRVVVLGRSGIVGRPISLLLGSKAPWGDATVTVVHSRSRRIPETARDADILIAAMGRPRMVTGDWVRPGAAVVDVGIHRIDDPSHPRGSRLTGDVEPESVDPVAGWLSPVPGGVGPLTVAMLLSNTVDAFERGVGGAPRPIWEAIPPADLDDTAGDPPRGTSGSGGAPTPT